MRVACRNILQMDRTTTMRNKNFYGTSDDAVKNRICIAISTHVIVAIMKKRLIIDPTLHTILQNFLAQRKR